MKHIFQAVAVFFCEAVGFGHPGYAKNSMDKMPQKDDFVLEKNGGRCLFFFQSKRSKLLLASFLQVAESDQSSSSAYFQRFKEHFLQNHHCWVWKKSGVKEFTNLNCWDFTIKLVEDFLSKASFAALQRCGDENPHLKITVHLGTKFDPLMI